MLFDSGVFVVFFLSFALLYWLVRRSIAERNLLIVVASGVFYGYWDVRFLGLLLITATVDFTAGYFLDRVQEIRRRRFLLVASLAANFGVLGYFKYFNFFVESLVELLTNLGIPFRTETLSIVLPVGISFYTFQSVSYVIDVYRREIRASTNLVEFLAYISFFPQLVAGPIERASQLLPQFQTTRLVSRGHIESGVWLILFGFFKKIVIADNLAPFVDLAYRHPEPGAVLMVVGTIGFAFQIYCDFSGYSDIALGLAKVLGFDLVRNFKLPYLARNIREFWQRWHVSLSAWFRDYVYIPLGGNRGTLAQTCSNLLVVMVLAGLWHGARANFLLWGFWHAMGLIGFHLWSAVSNKRKLPRFFSWGITVTWVLIGWMFFRAESIEAVYRYATALADWASPFWIWSYVFNVSLLCLPLFLFQIGQRWRGDVVPFPASRWSRAIAQGVLLTAILVMGQREEIQPFIYFQF